MVLPFHYGLLSTDKDRKFCEPPHPVLDHNIFYVLDPNVLKSAAVALFVTAAQVYSSWLDLFTTADRNLSRMI